MLTLLDSLGPLIRTSTLQSNKPVLMTMSPTRRTFLKQTSLLAAASALPARWVRAEDLPPDRKLKLRYAVASDLHYGHPGTSYHERAQDLVGWMNREKAGKGLDACLINGDGTHDKPSLLTELRDQHLSQLEMPYYCAKGNHDYLDAQPRSPTGSWEKIWGYPADHSFMLKDFAFVMADTSATANFRAWLAADRNWLQAEFAKYRDAAGIFVLIHIAQREEGVKGWPRCGVLEAEAAKGEAVMDLIESTPKVKAIFHGHNHDETGMWLSGGKRYFFTSRTGAIWGAAHGYRIVEVDEQHRMVTYQIDAREGKELNRNAI